MNQEKINPIQENRSENEQDKNEVSLNSGFQKRVRMALEAISETAHTKEERVSLILEKVNPFSNPEIISDEDMQRISLSVTNRIKESCLSEDKNEFIEKAYLAFEPLFELQNKDPKKFENILREAFIKQKGFIPVNEILSFGKYKTSIHLHLAPAETLKIKEKITVTNEGLKKIAKIIKDDEEIKKITATSWIIAQNPHLFEKFGFVIEGEEDKSIKEEHFDTETRPIWTASMSREEFLKRYL